MPCVVDAFYLTETIRQKEEVMQEDSTNVQGYKKKIPTYSFFFLIYFGSLKASVFLPISKAHFLEHLIQQQKLKN